MLGHVTSGCGMTRKRPLLHLSLSPDAIERLTEMATRCGETRSGMVERLIRDAEMPRPKTAPRRDNSEPKD